MTTVDFGYNQIRSVGRQYVYLRQTWQAGWTLYSGLHCLNATWSLSPSLPTATLQWDYGYVQPLDQVVYAAQRKLNVTGWYVKVVLETNTLTGTSNTWYGIVSHMEDEQQGIAGYGEAALATGRQTLHCYGLEKLLDTEYLSESWVDTGDAAPIVVQLPIVFNRGGRPNMNDRSIAPENGHVFEGQVLSPGTTNRSTAAWWTTWEICDYLLRWAVPKDSFRTRNKRVPFVMVNDALYLPLHDQPVVEQEGQTVLAILNRLIDRRRLRSFYTTVDETKTPHEAQVVVVAWNKELLDPGVSGADVLLGADADNRVISNVLYDYNQSTAAALRKTKVAKYDRIVVRGARRTSTGTFHVDATLLTAAWSTADETAYEAGASGEAGYAGWDRLKQQQRNAEVRASAELSAVFSWFKLPDAWAGGMLSPDAATSYPVFIDESANVAVPQCIHEVVWESAVPLYEHVDYSGAIIPTGTAADPPVYVYRQPLVVFKVPTDARHVAGDAISTLAEASVDPEAAGDGRNFRWSATCQVQPDSRVLEVRVSGEPQHVIAYTDFHTEKLAVDREVGKFDYKSKGMLITATLRDNRYAEGKYPPDGTDDSTLVDQKFGYVIYAGDEFRQDYVVPTTVVDVATDGSLVKSNGGYVRDDTPLLAALARVAYEWWSQERTILTLSTTQLTSGIQLGHFIETIGDATAIANIPGIGNVVNEHYETVNTVVSELRITWPRLEGNQRDMPRLEFTTGAGELDPMTIMPARVRTVTRSEARRTAH